MGCREQVIKRTVFRFLSSLTLSVDSQLYRRLFPDQLRTFDGWSPVPQSDKIFNVRPSFRHVLAASARFSLH